MTNYEVDMTIENKSLSQADIEVLIREMANSKTEKMEDLYTATSTAVFGYALSILKNKSDAEDVVHDCYLKVYQSCKTYKPQGKPLAWILTITRNLCLERLRKDSNITDTEIEDWMLKDEDALSTEEKLTLRESMLILGEEERQVVYLHAVTGLKHREIAKVMDSSLGTVLSKYNRAIKKLKVELEKGDS